MVLRHYYFAQYRMNIFHVHIFCIYTLITTQEALNRMYSRRRLKTEMDGVERSVAMLHWKRQDVSQ